MRLDEYLANKPYQILRKWLSTSGVREVISACVEKVSSKNSIEQNVELLKNERFIGMEFEIEGVHGALHETAVAKLKAERAYAEFCKYWRLHTDGSLRNNGRELISHVGLTLSAAPRALRALRDTFEYYFMTKELSITSRCSVHVHYNIWDYTFEQLRSLVFVYMMLESALYYVSGRRSNNIFCVPANKVARFNWFPFFTYFAKKNPKVNWMNLNGNFHKYAGLNLLPILEYGTIEFRHHEGTLDTDRILNWLAIINEVCESSRIHSMEEWHDIAKNAWESNEIKDLIEFISPTLMNTLNGVNLQALCEADLKYALWASVNNNEVTKIDDDDRVVTKTRKKIVSNEEIVLEWNATPNNLDTNF